MGSGSITVEIDYLSGVDPITGQGGQPREKTITGVTTSAIYQYLAVPFVALAGLNEWSARLPAAIAALGTSFLNWMLMRRLPSFPYDAPP